MFLNGNAGAKKKPNSTEHQVLRKKQIDSLKSSNPNVREIEKDTRFEVSFPGVELKLNVLLPPQFPDEPPIIEVQPAMSHPWINPQMLVIGHPKMSTWNAHANLGKLVKETGDEFKKNPPQILPTVNYGGNPPAFVSLPPSRPAPYANPAANRPAFPPLPPLPNSANPPALQPFSSQTYPPKPSSGVYHQIPVFPRPEYPPPSVSSSSQDPPWRRILEEKSDSLLESLHNDNSELEMFILTQNLLTQATQDKGALQKANEKLARENLEKEPKLFALQATCGEQEDLLRIQRMEYEQLLQQYQQAAKKFSPEVIIGKLKRAVTDSDKRSEDVAQAFLAGSMDQDEFVRQFVELRKAYHINAAKLERVQTDPSLLMATQNV